MNHASYVHSFTNYVFGQLHMTDSTNVMWPSTALVNMQNQCIEKEPATSFGDCCNDDGKD